MGSSSFYIFRERHTMTGQELCDLIKNSDLEDCEIHGVVTIDDYRYLLIFVESVDAEKGTMLTTHIKIETKRDFWSNIGIV